MPLDDLHPTPGPSRWTWQDVIELVGIDAEGFRLRIGGSLHWLSFARPCTSAQAVREALVELARASCWPAVEAPGEG